MKKQCTSEGNFGMFEQKKRCTMKYLGYWEMLERKGPIELSARYREQNPLTCNVERALETIYVTES